MRALLGFAVVVAVAMLAISLVSGEAWAGNLLSPKSSSEAEATATGIGIAGAHAHQRQGQQQGQIQGQQQESVNVLDVYNENYNSDYNSNRAYGGSSHSGSGALSGTSGSGNSSVNVEGDDYDFPAMPAPASSASSAAEESPCGDTTGVAAQGVGGGGSIATITETCRAYRLKLLEEELGHDAFETKLARLTHYLGWFPRLLSHMATLGVLH